MFYGTGGLPPFEADTAAPHSSFAVTVYENILCRISLRLFQGEILTITECFYNGLMYFFSILHAFMSVKLNHIKTTIFCDFINLVKRLIHKDPNLFRPLHRIAYILYCVRRTIASESFAHNKAHKISCFCCLGRFYIPYATYLYSCHISHLFQLKKPLRSKYNPLWLYMGRNGSAVPPIFSDITPYNKKTFYPLPR